MTLDTALERLHRFLSGWPGSAAVVGGLAIVARVRARPTRDADVVLVVPEADVEKLLRHARELDYVLPSDTDDWLKGGLLPLREADGSFSVDLILADDAFLEGVTQRAQPLKLGSVTLPIGTLEDLVLLKLHAGRPIDIDDVLAIKDAYGGELDRAFLRSHAAALGIIDQLELYFPK